MAHGDNRRRYHRSRVKVQFNLAKASSSLATVSAITRDLSLGGACIVAEEMLPDFSIIHVTFTHPNTGEETSVESRVLWCRAPGTEGGVEEGFLAGIQFLNLHTQSAKDLIQALMKRKR